MQNYDFSEFDIYINSIINNLSDDEKKGIKNIISKTLTSYIDDPEYYNNTIKFRKKIRELEEKVLLKLKKIKTKSKKQGETCYFCGIYDSDTNNLIWLSKNHAICDNCIILIKEVVNKETENL